MHQIHNLYLMSSTVQIIQSRVSSSWPWYIIRASGFTAAGLLILITISGIGQVTGFTYRFINPILSWTIHKALAFALCAAVLIHGGFLLLDHFVTFSIPQILIPFLSTYNNGSEMLGLPLGFLGVASGIVAMYGIFIIVASSLKLIDTNKRTWKKLHYLSYLVAILVFIHALYTGSDLKYGTFRLGFLSLEILLIIGIISRIYRAGIIKE